MNCAYISVLPLQLTAIYWSEINRGSLRYAAVRCFLLCFLRVPVLCEEFMLLCVFHYIYSC